MIQDVSDITSFKWATVTGLNPLAIKLDGDTAALALIPDSLIDPTELIAGDRVRVELSLRKCVIHGAASGGGQSGEIKLTAATTGPPRGWMFAAGQSLLRSDYYRLFIAIGTTYGAVDATHFSLPDMRGRVAVGQDGGQAEFVTPGQMAGEKSHALSVAEMPAHTHDLILNRGSNPANSSGGTQGYLWGESANSKLSGSTGGGTAHNNLQPYLVLNYIIKI